MINFNSKIGCVGLLLGSAFVICQSQSAQAQAVNYTLPGEVVSVYPNDDWLPKVYQGYYSDYTVEEVIELFTSDSLQRDGIKFDSIDIEEIPYKFGLWDYIVSIESEDPRAQDYSTIHPKFVENYLAALKGVKMCKRSEGCWNKNNNHADEPWAFFPQFGLPMASQKSVLMLNYPPTTALTRKDYLDTFTMHRWSRVLATVGIDDPVLFQTIVDIRPIAAPGSGTSQNLPNAQTYFNDDTGTTGGYYIAPQLALMVAPPSAISRKRTLPLVVLGSPAREQWRTMTGLPADILDTGVTPIIPGGKPTPYILGNHPDVTTYQCCPGDRSSRCDSFDLLKSEEADLQIACWAQSMAADGLQDPKDALANCKEKWVTKRSPEDDLAFCAVARMDSNECFGKDIEWATAISYCKEHGNNPCATFACPSK